MWDNQAFADLLNSDGSFIRVNFGMETFIPVLQNRSFWLGLYGSTEAEGL